MLGHIGHRGSAPAIQRARASGTGRPLALTMSLKKPGGTGPTGTGRRVLDRRGQWILRCRVRHGLVHDRLPAGEHEGHDQGGYPADTRGEQVDEDEQPQVLDLAGDADQRGKDVQQRETGDQPDPEHGTLS